MDDKNENVVVYPAFIFLILTYFVLSITDTGWMLIVAGLLLGAGYGNISSSMQAIAIKVSPPAKYGIATSTYFIGLDLGLGVGPYLMGILKSLTSFRGLYVISGIIPLICTVLYLGYNHKKKQQIKLEMN